MGKEHSKEILPLLQPFGEDITALVMWLRDFVWDLYPTSNELIYDNYNTSGIGWSLTDKQTHIFCLTAVYRTNKNIHFGFLYGKGLSDPDEILLGQGNQYRYILVTDKNKFPQTYIKKLIKESYTEALMKLKDGKQVLKGQTIVKAIATKKNEKSPRPPVPKKKKK